MNLAVSGDSSRLRCNTSWMLYSGPRIIASGNSGACDEPEIALPASVAPGRYRLQIDAHAVRDGELSLSDAVSVQVSVLAHNPSPAAR
jgi:hypothetical protein